MNFHHATQTENGPLYEVSDSMHKNTIVIFIQIQVTNRLKLIEQILTDLEKSIGKIGQRILNNEKY